MDDHSFNQLLDYFDLSWTGYRKVRKGVKKRIRRHMRETCCNNMSWYLSELEKDRTARKECERLMTVPVSRFFRDPPLWITLQLELIPGLIESSPGRITVWSAGCACGEEVYSLKIVWHRLKERYPGLNDPDIIATDLNPENLTRAKSGIYGSSSLRALSEKVVSSCFESGKGGRQNQVRSFLKNRIRWKKHNFLSTPPGRDFHLIFLRNNLLTYYDNRKKTEAFGNIVNALATDGILVIGSREALPCQASLLDPLPSHPFIFRKIKNPAAEKNYADMQKAQVKHQRL